MLFYKRSTCWKHLRGIELVPMDAVCWVRWGEGIKTIINRFFLKTSFHASFSFIYLCYIFLFFGLCLLLLLVPFDIESCFVCLGLAYEIYSGGGPSMYIYCVVCHRVIAAPYVRNVVHVFAYLYTLDDDSEHPMDSETSLLPNVFTSHCSDCVNVVLLYHKASVMPCQNTIYLTSSHYYQ